MKFINAEVTPPPKDGTLIQLLVKLSDDGFPTEDSNIFRTIGFNSLEDTGEDFWQYAGWNWCHDVFTNATEGEIIGWQHLPELALEV